MNLKYIFDLIMNFCFFPTKICDMNQDDRSELVRNDPRYANKKLHTTGVSGSSSSSSSLLSSISSVTSALASAMSSLRGLLSVTLATKGCYVDGQRQKTSTWIRNLVFHKLSEEQTAKQKQHIQIVLCVFMHIWVILQAVWMVGYCEITAGSEWSQAAHL